MTYHNTTNTNKRTQLTLSLKAKLLKQLFNKDITPSQICQHYAVHPSTVSTWIKQKDSILKHCDSNDDELTYRDRKSKFPQIEDKLYEWYNKVHSLYPITNIPITETMLLAKANQLSNHKFNISFIQRFMRKKHLTLINLHGEGNSNTRNTSINIDNIKSILDKYDPHLIYNMDETSLFFRILPSRTIIKETEKKQYRGGKVDKTRITLAITVNMSDKIRIPILFIGKTNKPRCFKDIPFNYIKQAKGWMDRSCFYYYINKILIPNIPEQYKNQRILLIMDNFSGHPRISNYKNVDILYLPPNSTSFLQPLDQGIIASLKLNYKNIILNKYISSLDNYERINTANKKTGISLCLKPSIAEALYYMTLAFDQMKSSTVINCFIKANILSDRQKDMLNRILDENPIEEDKIMYTEKIYPFLDIIPNIEFDTDEEYQMSIIDDELSNITDMNSNIRSVDKKVKRKLSELLELVKHYPTEKRQKLEQTLKSIKI